jgi:ferrous iron transport protein B
MSHSLSSPNPRAAWSVALVGNPNCGKTALFNLLTGARQKVANYAGVTVERKVGSTRLPARTFR